VLLCDIAVICLCVYVSIVILCCYYGGNVLFACYVVLRLCYDVSIVL